MACDSAASPLERIRQHLQKQGGDAVFKKRLPLWQKDHSLRIDRRQRCCRISVNSLKQQLIRLFCRVFEVARDKKVGEWDCRTGVSL
jgi:hypothetical protein